jgi:hypothetical protein
VRLQFPNQKVVIGEAHDGVQMSEVLREFVAPYYKAVDTEDEYRKLLDTAIVAWNVALLPAKKRKAHLEKILETIPEQAREDGRAIINELIIRKERCFSEHKRMIVDYVITDTEENYHLFVISTLD